ncbi:MAG: DUF2244 domain-containing protein [Alphaproteobacteria bacterium]|nr:DUF2244 domain-containing protein [Alphaproteobacteria bacterium]
MTPSTPTSGTVLLDQVLRPSPPLSPRVLIRILAAVAFINLAFVAYFVVQGAWPIAPFMGLDVVLLGWAFRASTIAAKREEHIRLTPAELSVERRFPKKPLRAWQFNPYWVRVDMPEPAEHDSQLTLWSHGKFLRIAQFVAPAERAKFATHLKNALRQARETHA